MTQQAESERRAALEKRWGHLLFDRWEQMKWFVTLANTDLEACSEGDILNLQAQCEAIRMVPLALSHAPRDSKRVNWKRYVRSYGWIGSASPTVHELKAIHKAIKQPLEDLADGVEDIKFCSVSVSHTIDYLTTNEAQRKAGYAPHMINSHAVMNGSDTWPGDFMFRAAQLLETYVDRTRIYLDSIRRCPHCTKVFLQQRRNARYCGRTCHAAAGMQRLREKQRAEKALKLKRKTQRKGRAPHGTKKHR